MSGCVCTDRGGRTGGQQAREGRKRRQSQRGGRRAVSEGKEKGSEQDSKDERDNMQSGEMQDRDTGKRQATF